MIHRKPTLGRGLADLLGARATPAMAPPVGEQLTKLPLDVLERGRYQPRVDMRPETLTELADSIKSQGVVQPIVVRPLEPPANGESQRYEIIAGERRWRAAQMAGLAEIPAVIRHIPDEAAIAVALIENIQRENLNPLEEARALERQGVAPAVERFLGRLHGGVDVVGAAVGDRAERLARAGID